MPAKGSSKTYPADLVARVRELYARGMCQGAVARAVGITPKVAWRLFRRHGIEVRGSQKRVDAPEGEQNAHRDWCRRRRAKVIAALGGKCARCGFDDPRALQIDHINGGGRRDENTRGLNSFYNDVLVSVGTKYQCLCANCNAIKRVENKEVPSNRRSSNKPTILRLRREHPEWSMRAIARAVPISYTLVRRHLLAASSQ